MKRAGRRLLWLAGLGLALGIALIAAGHEALSRPLMLGGIVTGALGAALRGSRTGGTDSHAGGDGGDGGSDDGGDGGGDGGE